jgi:DNA-binding NarL/FixJ family response regulator
VVCAYDDWLANQLRELISERKWVLQEFRKPSAWVTAAHVRQPCVAIMQVDFSADQLVALSAIRELHHRNPNAEIVVVCDTKMSDEDRPGWTASALDLGARLVLFPPLTRVVIEDAVSGLMGAQLRRPEPTLHLPPAIDLAAGEYEADPA